MATSARKMVVLLLKRTKGVVGAVTRGTSGVPKDVSEIVGRALVVRPNNANRTLAVPAEELDVREVDYDQAVFSNPRAYVVDGSSASAPSVKVTDLDTTTTAGSVTVTLSSHTVADGKAVLVVIENGAKPASLLTGKTTFKSPTITIPLPASIDPGDHQAFASVEGFAGHLLTLAV